MYTNANADMSRYFRTGYGRKNRFMLLRRSQVCKRVGHVPENVNFKAQIDFVFGFSPSPYPPSEIHFYDGFDSHKESMPGVHKSFKIRALVRRGALLVHHL
jgi:hypothetical protein